jgi:hypothetical protein
MKRLVKLSALASRGTAHEELAEDCPKTSQSKTEKAHSECEYRQGWVIIQ